MMVHFEDYCLQIKQQMAWQADICILKEGAQLIMPAYWVGTFEWIMRRINMWPDHMGGSLVLKAIHNKCFPYERPGYEATWQGGVGMMLGFQSCVFFLRKIMHTGLLSKFSSGDFTCKTYSNSFYYTYKKHRIKIQNWHPTRITQVRSLCAVVT